MSMANLRKNKKKKSVDEMISEMVRRIVKKFHPDKIILFGSHARGTAGPDSDVDLLVIMKTKAREIDRYVAVSNLLYPRQFPVDILVKTPKEMEAETRRKGNFFMHEILKKGKVLYERSR